MTQGADAPLGRRAEGRVDEELASSPLGRRDSRGQLRRRSSRGELPERTRGEEARGGSLECGDGIELRDRRFDGVLVMVENRPTCLLLQGGRTSVVEQDRVERGRVPGRWNAAKDRHLPGARVIRQREPWRQRDGQANGGVCLDARRADSVLVQRVVNQELVVRVRLLDDPLHVGQGEGARVLAVTREARTPVAAERLLVEELLAIELDAKLILAEPL